MSEQQELSPAQAAVVEKMKECPTIVWWSLEDFQCLFADLDDLVEKEILIYGSNPIKHWWRLSQRALDPVQKRIVEKMQNKAAQECWKPDNLPGENIDLQILEEEGIIETVYRLTKAGLEISF